MKLTASVIPVPFTHESIPGRDIEVLIDDSGKDQVAVAVVFEPRDDDAPFTWDAPRLARLITFAGDLISDVRVVLAGFKTDPGTSDLDDEQPINVWMTLGDYRRMARRVAVLDRPL